MRIFAILLSLTVFTVQLPVNHSLAVHVSIQEGLENKLPATEDTVEDLFFALKESAIKNKEKSYNKKNSILNSYGLVQTKPVTSKVPLFIKNRSLLI